jgi:hypothetical protein
MIAFEVGRALRARALGPPQTDQILAGRGEPVLRGLIASGVGGGQ